MSLLAQLNNYWVLAGSDGDTKWRGAFTVRLGRNMPFPTGFDWRAWTGTRYCTLDATLKRTMKWYHTIIFMDYEIEPLGWNAESAEPVLYCQLFLRHIDAAASDAHDAERRMWWLLRNGWSRDDRTYCTGYLHVGDIKKVEGAPPEGAF
jgi:hypothetical protein